MSLNLTDKRFGKLVGVRRVANIGIHAGWLFQCDCGGTLVARGAFMGLTYRSSPNDCGCVKRARIASRAKAKDEARQAAAQKRVERKEARRAAVIAAMVERGESERNAKRRANRMSRQRMCQIILQAAGLCSYCGQPRGRSITFCDTCLVRANERERTRLGRKTRYKAKA